MLSLLYCLLELPNHLKDHQGKDRRAEVVLRLQISWKDFGSNENCKIGSSNYVSRNLTYAGALNESLIIGGSGPQCIQVFPAPSFTKVPAPAPTLNSIPCCADLWAFWWWFQKRSSLHCCKKGMRSRNWRHRMCFLYRQRLRNCNCKNSILIDDCGVLVSTNSGMQIHITTIMIWAAITIRRSHFPLLDVALDGRGIYGGIWRGWKTSNRPWCMWWSQGKRIGNDTYPASSKVYYYYTQMNAHSLLVAMAPSIL